MTNAWRVLPIETAAPSALLERSLALLDGMARDPVPTLRWYRATGTAIVLGRGQRLEPSPSTLTQLTQLARGSGGGAVLLDPALLSLDVVLPTGHAWLGGDLAAVFLRVGDAWAGALADLGVAGVSVHHGPSTASRRGDARQRLLAAVCFATVGRGEVLAGGRKIVGLAQRRRRHGALVQCGLLRRWDPDPLLAALGAPVPDPEIASAAVGLDELLAQPPSDEAVASAVSARLTG